MSEGIISIQNGIKKTDSERLIMNNLNLTINKGDFITILGGNGAGKSTLFNVISGNMKLTSGNVLLDDKSINHLSEEKRANFIGRVFQDPKLGTAPRMTVAENLLLASKRGQKRGLAFRKLKEQKESFYQLCQTIGNGLENHLDTPTGSLSGGQRQALSLLMSTIQKPDLLLLDEHTAALDPKTAQQIMTLTQKIVSENQLSCLMITHRMEDALTYGNRLIVLEAGQIVYDIPKDQKKELTMQDVLNFFN
ncbi:ATP-binding cassette domain-containing protein [Vagococcus sp. DIV0080]|uniref:ATP-binding cassette domain-containing protein n=1 Tax=Candidatus Vagococcus giribetii TaxID=2230876 RepID=A0ABS3HUK0_9ENTE|nr:ATP-binding cassette domain-containing protein [Vagococcus sp. DIV0080]MBO0476912.1 ATP-binding cassette domain-containing protein [Vagococcus sp. DIV0080]